MSGRIKTLGLAAALLVAQRATAADANSALGFESVSDWSVSNGSIIGLSPEHTQGAAALAVHASGYTLLTSGQLSSLGVVSSKISFDLGLPASAGSGWAGAAQIFVSIPSKGVNNAYIGQVELTGLKAGQYNRLTFPVPDSLLVALRSTYTDLTFSISLNVPINTQNIYLLDNFEVSPSIPPNSTVGLQDRLPILGFETQTPAWTISSGTITGLSATATQGLFSLAFRPNGYTTLTSPALSSLGPVASTFSFDLFQPVQNPAPSFSAAQLYVNIPSQGVSNAYLGQVDLRPLGYGAFHRVNFTVPSALISKLNAQYTDLKFTIAINVPTGTNAIYYIDHFQVGTITTPPSALPSSPGPGDLVGTATSGLVGFTLDGSSSSLPINQANFRVTQPEPSCVPSATQACRYVVNLATASVGAFTASGQSFGGATFTNNNPFEVVMGGRGASSLSSALPANAYFTLSTKAATGAVNAVLGLAPGAASSITIAPQGGGMISMSGQFQGTVDSHTLSVNMAVTANTPLANRPPVASAGPDQSITSSKCRVTVTLDGSASTDPDNNIRIIRWFEGDTFVGSGPHPVVWLRSPGVHTITAVVEDNYGSTSRDDVAVTANIPSVCFANPK